MKVEWNRKGNLGSYLSETQTTNQQRGKLTQFIGLKDDNNLVHILSYHLHKSGWNLTIKHYCLLESLQTLNVKIKIIKIKNCPGGYSWPHTIHHLPYPPMLWLVRCDRYNLPSAFLLNFSSIMISGWHVYSGLSLGLP